MSYYVECVLSSSHVYCLRNNLILILLLHLFTFIMSCERFIKPASKVRVNVISLIIICLWKRAHFHARTLHQQCVMEDLGKCRFFAGEAAAWLYQFDHRSSELMLV